MGWAHFPAVAATLEDSEREKELWDGWMWDCWRGGVVVFEYFMEIIFSIEPGFAFRAHFSRRCGRPGRVEDGNAIRC